MRLKRLLIGISTILLVATGTISCVTQPFVRPAALERHVRVLAVTLHPRSVDTIAAVRALHAVAMEF